METAMKRNNHRVAQNYHCHFQNLPQRYLKADVTDEMCALLDIPFTRLMSSIHYLAIQVPEIKQCMLTLKMLCLIPDRKRFQANTEVFHAEHLTNHQFQRKPLSVTIST